MLQGFLWLFDDPIADMLLASTFVLVALQFRQLRLMQHRTDALACEVSELKVLVRTMSYVPEVPGMTRTEFTNPVRRAGAAYLSDSRKVIPVRRLNEKLAAGEGWGQLPMRQVRAWRSRQTRQAAFRSAARPNHQPYFLTHIWHISGCRGLRNSHPDKSPPLTSASGRSSPAQTRIGGHDVRRVFRH